ncbi:MAG: hypothetical protein WAW17_15095, partial [Rhodococcus sp. (in: high G+C Gram-positive bacteria)]
MKSRNIVPNKGAPTKPFTIVVALAASLALVSGCSADRGEDASAAGPTSAVGAAASPTSEGAFGTLASPCGEGDAKGATDQGVTDTEIKIGYGDDRGYAKSPGLNREMSDA